MINKSITNIKNGSHNNFKKRVMNTTSPFAHYVINKTFKAVQRMAKLHSEIKQRFDVRGSEISSAF